MGVVENLGSIPIAPMWRKRLKKPYIMPPLRFKTCRLLLGNVVKRGLLKSQKVSFFLNTILKRMKFLLSAFYFQNQNFFLFFVKVGYFTWFIVAFSIAYFSIFPTIEEENFSRAFQVFLQLSLFLFFFRTTKEKKQWRWLLLIGAFSSVLATLFLKNVMSLQVILFVVVPLLCFLIIRLPSDVLPFAILMLYFSEKGLAQWAFFLLFQLIIYYLLCFFLDERPKHSICPFLILIVSFWVLGKVWYSADFLREPARLTALVSGACIIFLCFRKRGKVAFLVPFFIYLISSTAIGVISIASAPGGDKISYPFPFLFLFCHFFLFFGFFLFQRKIRSERQPLVPLLFGGFLYCLPYFPNLEWLEGWIEGLDLFLLLLGILLFVCDEENE